MERILTLPRFMAFLLSYHVFEEITMEKAGKCTKKEVHHGILGEEQLGGARLRTRKVTGRDASLPAPFVDFFL